MDPALYKDFKTSRGFKYHYYFSPASASSKPTLLFLHGFPSTSKDWTRAVTFFSKEGYGYGILVPDLLGYGGTDKPTDPDAYRMKNMTKDIVELVDAEKLDNVVNISHDWGSGLNSRLANYFPERFAAFAFLALGYLPPVATFDIDVVNKASLEKYGYDKFGYWKFFAKEGSEKITQDHLDSFFSMVYTLDAGAGKKHWCPDGALEEWLLADRKTTKLVCSEDEKRSYIDEFSKGGMAGPFCWYKAMVFKLTPADDAEIPQSAYPITKPVFLGTSTHDATCVASEQVAIVNALCPDATVREFDAGHWVLHQRPEEVNGEIKKWLDGLVQASQGAQSKY